MGIDPTLIDGSIRISLCHETTEEEIEKVIALFPTAVQELRGGK
jgi:cysteine sulfinate desulfinase/cysteine desulfurase-like protein